MATTTAQSIYQIEQIARLPEPPQAAHRRAALRPLLARGPRGVALHHAQGVRLPLAPRALVVRRRAAPHRHRPRPHPARRGDERDPRPHRLGRRAGRRVHPAGGVHGVPGAPRAGDRRRHPPARPHRVHAGARHRPRGGRARADHRRPRVRRVPAPLRRGGREGDVVAVRLRAVRGDPPPVDPQGGAGDAGGRRRPRPRRSSPSGRRRSASRRRWRCCRGCTGGRSSTA